MKDFSSNRLYRNTDQGLIFGVCAGIADYFGWDVTIVRLLFIVGAFFFGGPLVPIAYVVLGLLLPKNPWPHGYEPTASDDFQRRVRSEPHASLSSVRYRFRELDGRLQRIEKYVTSDRFKLDREFERLRD